MALIMYMNKIWKNCKKTYKILLKSSFACIDKHGDASLKYILILQEDTSEIVFLFLLFLFFLEFAYCTTRYCHLFKSSYSLITVFRFYKGQIISKGIFGVFKSTKKTMKGSSTFLWSCGRDIQNNKVPLLFLIWSLFRC